MRCGDCIHWKPYWTGEAWGVRSFVDAPKAEQEAILATLHDRMSENDFTEDSISSPTRNPAILERVLGTNWPEWGECKLTELTEDTTTLARALDGSEYMAVLCCHANFGCVQFAQEDGHAD